MAAASLSMKRRTEDARPLIVLEGAIDEGADLEKVFDGLEGEVIFDLSGIERVNSRGGRAWMNALRARAGAGRLRPVFRACSVPLVEQANMMTGFFASGVVESFYAPYTCAITGRPYEMLLSIARHFPDPRHREAPVLPCPDDPALLLDFADHEEEYLVFLSEAVPRQAPTAPAS